MAALVLAAGAGRRLAPLSRLRPKALCPVAGTALVDLALAKAQAVVGGAGVAVNVHHGREQLEAHLAVRNEAPRADAGRAHAGPVHVSVEEPVALGTAGAVAHLRPWLDGRPVVVVNADTWHTASLAPLLAGWDGGEVVRVLVAGPPGATLGRRSPVLASLLPASEVAGLPHEPWGLWEASWRHRLAEGRLETVAVEVTAVDCGSPADYLAANLAASGGASVVGSGARVEGELVRSVVWPGGVVPAGEVLVDAIRVGERFTVRLG